LVLTHRIVSLHVRCRPPPISTLFPYTTLFRSACNADTSCLKGFCPSFVTVTGKRRKAAPAPLPVFDHPLPDPAKPGTERAWNLLDRKSTRLNSSHVKNSYAVFCLKKKT